MASDRTRELAKEILRVGHDKENGIVALLSNWERVVTQQAQQEMRDMGFQHPKDVEAMILSTEKAARINERRLMRKEYIEKGNKL